MNHLTSIRPKQWDNYEVKALIKMYKKHLNDFSNYNIKVVDVWKTISEKLSHMGINKSGVECDKKWRNLKSAFKKIYCDMERTEKSKYQWEFFEDLSELMLSAKQLRRAAPIVLNNEDNDIYKVNVKRKQSEDSQVTHIYTVIDAEKSLEVSRENQLETDSQSIYIEVAEPPIKRMMTEEAKKELNVLEISDEEQTGKLDVIESNETWTQNSLFDRLKLMHEKLDKIIECQAQHSAILKSLTKRLENIEDHRNAPR